jgi:hypothetical protein
VVPATAAEDSAAGSVQTHADEAIYTAQRSIRDRLISRTYGLKLPPR